MSGFASTSIPDLTSEYNDMFWHKFSYPALEIFYLAVSESYREMGMGKRITERMADADKEAKIWWVLVYYSRNPYCQDYNATGFYHKCAFTPCELPNSNKDSLRMFRTLYPIK